MFGERTGVCCRATAVGVDLAPDGVSADENANVGAAPGVAVAAAG